MTKGEKLLSEVIKEKESQYREKIRMKRMNNLDNFIKNLLEETKKTRDRECIELSQRGEIEYIQTAKKRISHVINHIDFIIKNYSSKKPIKLLDVGTTPFTFLYKDYFGIDVSTIDRTNLLKQRCEKRGITFKKCDLMKEKIPFKNGEFDICVFTEVFEHLIVSPANIFKEIRRILKDKGFLIFSTPNIATLFNRIRLLFGKPILKPVDKVFKENCDGGWVHGFGHIREYTLFELINLLKKYQFSIIKFNHIGETDFIKNKNFSLLAFVYLLFQKIVPSFRNYNLILVKK